MHYAVLWARVWRSPLTGNDAKVMFSSLFFFFFRCRASHSHIYFESLQWFANDVALADALCAAASSNDGVVVDQRVIDLDRLYATEVALLFLLFYL